MNKHRRSQEQAVIPGASPRALFLCALLGKQGIFCRSMAPVCFLPWHCPNQDPQALPLL